MRRAIYTGMSVMSVMLSVAASLAAPPLRWDTQQANPKAADWYIYRGEAVDLMPRLVDGTKPADITDTPATLRYREPALEPGTYRAIAATNTAPGTWLIPWRAEHDSGAPYYDYQLWIGDGPSASARITGKIIMRDSIGIPPGGPPPPPIASYATPADLQAASNALANATATALTQAKEYTDTKIAALPPATNATAISGGALAQATNVAEAVVAAAAPTLAVASAATVTGPQSNLIASALQPSWAVTGTVSRAQAATMLASTNGNVLVNVGADGTMYVSVITNTTAVYVKSVSGTGYNGPAVGVRWLAVNSWSGSFFMEYDDIGIWVVETTLGESTGYWGAIGETLPLVLSATVEDVSFGSLTLDWVPATNTYEIATKEDIPPPGLTIQEADSRYLSSTPGWFWQGSKAVITNEWTGVPHAPAQAGPGVNNFELIPYTTSRTDATGTVTITSSHYIVGVGCDWHLAEGPDPTIPKMPMMTSSRRIDGNTWELTAYCSSNPYDANLWYYAYASNIVVMTYDRQEMHPGAYTNDAAGIITRVDDAPRGRNSTRFDDDRRAINAGTLEAYVDARKTEIADKAWRRTPSGKDAPSAYTVTIDQPMVMQGQIAYLNSGDYYIMSYQGGDWYNSVTGSVWRIGPAGSVSFEIASTNRLLHIQGFHVSGGYATLDISTNWVHGIPAVEFTDSLINQQWLEAPEQIATDHGSYWRVVLPSGDKKMRFFRAVDRQGDNRIISHVTHEFKDDIILFGRRYSSLAELKQALEELD